MLVITGRIIHYLIAWNDSISIEWGLLHSITA